MDFKNMSTRDIYFGVVTTLISAMLIAVLMVKGSSHMKGKQVYEATTATQKLVIAILSLLIGYIVALYNDSPIVRFAIAGMILVVVLNRAAT